MAPRGDLDGFWRFSLPIVGVLLHLLLRMKITGEENIPSEGPALLAGNHVSSLDGVVLAGVTAHRSRRRTRFLVAAEFFASPGYSQILRWSSQIPIHRGARDLAALREAENTLRAGALTGIYPEGGVAEFPELGMRPGKSGAARLALATGASVIPVGIWGTQVRWPWAGFSFKRPWRPTIALVYGAPLRPEGQVDDVKDLQRFTERIMAAIGEQLARAQAMVEAAR